MLSSLTSFRVDGCFQDVDRALDDHVESLPGLPLPNDVLRSMWQWCFVWAKDEKRLGQTGGDTQTARETYTNETVRGAHDTGVARGVRRIMNVLFF